MEDLRGGCYGLYRNDDIGALRNENDRLRSLLDALVEAGDGMRVGLVYDLSEGGAGALVEKDPWRKHRQALAAAKGWRKEPSDG